MEEGNMKTPDGRLRTRTYLLLVLLISAGLAAFGILTGSTMVVLAMNLFGTDATGVLGSGSTPWLLISLGLGLVGLGMRCRKKIFPRHVGAGDGQRFHRIRPELSRRNDVCTLDRHPVIRRRSASRELPGIRQRHCDGDEAGADSLDRPRISG
jgi:hypothetical protein